MSLFRCIECGQLISLRRTRCKSCERVQGRLHNMATQRAAYRDPVYRSMGKPDANERCALCGLPGPDTWDHIVCLVHGGTNVRTNLRPVHRGCNSGRRCTGECRDVDALTFHYSGQHDDCVATIPHWHDRPYRPGEWAATFDDGWSK